MNLDFDYIKEVFPIILKASGITLKIACISLVLSFVIALILAVIRYYRVPFFNQVVKVYVSFFRGTPALAQIMLIYFGIFGLNDYLKQMPAIVAAITALSLNASAYMSETIRGSFKAIDRGQIEAGLSIGMSSLQVMARIIFPQSMVIALPSLLNTLIDLIKGTSLAFVIGVPEMMAVANYEGSRAFKYFEIYVVVSIIYWTFSLILTRLQKVVEKKLNFYD